MIVVYFFLQEIAAVLLTTKTILSSTKCHDLNFELNCYRDAACISFGNVTKHCVELVGTVGVVDAVPRPPDRYRFQPEGPSELRCDSGFHCDSRGQQLELILSLEIELR